MSETIDQLREEIEAAHAAQSDVPAEEVTIGDVAAAAFVALETLTMILPPEEATGVIAEFERRAQQFRDDDAADTSEGGA